MKQLSENVCKSSVVNSDRRIGDLLQIVFHIFLTEPVVQRCEKLSTGGVRLHSSTRSVKYVSRSLDRRSPSKITSGNAGGQNAIRRLTDGWSLSLSGDASQIGIWDSNKGLMLDQVDRDRNATPAADRNATRIITTIAVSRSSLIITKVMGKTINIQQQLLRLLLLLLSQWSRKG